MSGSGSVSWHDRRGLTKPKRFVQFFALRADELNDFPVEIGAANPHDLHRRKIDEIAGAFEPDTVAIGIGLVFLVLARGHLAPHAIERLPDIGMHARGVLERRIENGFHLGVIPGAIARTRSDSPAASVACSTIPVYAPEEPGARRQGAPPTGCPLFPGRARRSATAPSQQNSAQRSGFFR